MAYIIVVNPQILAQAGMPPDGVVFATCVSAAVATLVMGLYANYPIALAPGMSLNAYFTYSVCIAMHVPWRTALAVVFCWGVLFLVLTVTRVREQIVNGMPDCLKHSTAAGIGMFIAFVGLRNAKLVVANPATYVGLGSFADKEVQTACFGLGLTLVLMSRRLHGAILIGIFGTALLGILRGITKWPTAIFAMPHPSSTFLQLDFRGASHLGLLEILFAFLFVDLFDNVGTLVGVCEQGGFIKDDEIPRVGRVLVADAVHNLRRLDRNLHGDELHRERCGRCRRGAYRSEQCRGRRALSACHLLLTAGHRDSSLCDRPRPDPGWRSDDAIHCANRVAGIQRSCASLYHYAGHAAYIQHRDRPQPRSNFVHRRESGFWEDSRSKRTHLDPHDPVYSALRLSRRSLGRHHWLQS
jgi:hypothetical protein